jgi:hypothetical protein
LGFSLAVLVSAAFDGDRSLVPFAVYVLAVTIIGVVTTRSVVAAENVGLSLLALFFGATALVFVAAAVREVVHNGRSSIVLVVLLLAGATSMAVFCGFFVSLIVKFQRQMR